MSTNDMKRNSLFMAMSAAAVSKPKTALYGAMSDGSALKKSKPSAPVVSSPRAPEDLVAGWCACLLNVRDMIL